MEKTGFRLPILATALAAGMGALFGAAPSPAPAREERIVPGDGDARALRHIVEKRDETWGWQRLMGVQLTPHEASAARSGSPAYRRWVLRLWERRAYRAWMQAHDPPHRADWLCIHRYEGAWNDPDPPYYGGLQMDTSFQRTYGPELLRRKGTADSWTPLEQMWVAERAHRRGRGFYPWPNTARLCGLIEQ